MSKTLTEIAQQLRDAKVIKRNAGEATVSDPKVQLIYAFNGTGKTRLSRAFKELIAPKRDGDEGAGLFRSKILYYNAFTEDLFYWKNDSQEDAKPTLKIQPNWFTDWVLKEQGQDQNIIANFQHYTSDKITPRFNDELYDLRKVEDVRSEKNIRSVYAANAFSEVTFSLSQADADDIEYIKISKGEESCFVWSVFYSMLGACPEFCVIGYSILQGTYPQTEWQNSSERTSNL